MASFKFKEKDEVLLCTTSKYYGQHAGSVGCIKEIKRNYLGRIEAVIIEWTFITTIPKSSEHGQWLTSSRPPKSWTLKAAIEHLGTPTACHTCIHRVQRLAGSCQGKTWTYVPAVVEKRLKKIREEKKRQPNVSMDIEDAC